MTDPFTMYVVYLGLSQACPAAVVPIPDDHMSEVYQSCTVTWALEKAPKTEAKALETQPALKPAASKPQRICNPGRVLKRGKCVRKK